MLLFAFDTIMKLEKRKNKELVKIYGVDPPCIYKIVNNRSWHDDNYIPPFKEKRLYSPKKLNIEIATEIRLKYATGKYLMDELAEEYGVSHTCVSDIIISKHG